MGSPIPIGAHSTTAPPGEARSARGASDLRADDRTLIEAVRAGNVGAFGTLYERHVGAARCLARRLCCNRADADDVVADVFTNTLRAIKRGRGPRDDLRPYVLTATRHSVIKLRTRRDSGRAIPTADDQLDVPVLDEPSATDEGGEAIGAAFEQLPDRFRNVLWLSCVEGIPPAEVGRRAALSAGAASSLTMRARRALARSYLVSQIEQPAVSADCRPTRDLMPSVIRGEASAGTVGRVDRHLATCDQCRDAFEEMQSVAASMRSFPWLAAVLAWLRSLSAPGGATGLAPVLVTAVAVATFTTGDAGVRVTPAEPRSPAHAAVAGTDPVRAEWAATSLTPVASAAAVAPAPVIGVDGIDEPPPRETASTTELREGGVRPAVVPVPAVGLPDASTVLDDVALDPIEQIVTDVTTPVAPVSSGTVDTTVDTTLDTTLDAVDQLGEQVASTAGALATTTSAVLDGIDAAVVDVLEVAGAEQAAAAVGPLLESTTGVVEPVAAVTGGTVVDSTSPATSTVNDLLSGHR